jgi:hypothetical protein
VTVDLGQIPLPVTLDLAPHMSEHSAVCKVLHGGRHGKLIGIILQLYIVNVPKNRTVKRAEEKNTKPFYGINTCIYVNNLK